MNDNDISPVSPLRVALGHCCPVCGEGHLYRSILTLKDTCSICGADFRRYDVGDGAAFFTITLLGFVVVGLAIALEVFVRPPYWVHALSVAASMVVLTPLSLRFFKSYLVGLKHKHHISQGVE